MKLLPLAGAISIALLSSNVIAESSPVEFNGYMRGGVGLSSESGANNKWNVERVGRLGNENDLYGEFGLKKEVASKDDVSFVVDSMMAYWEGQDSNSQDKKVNVVQLNVQANGLFDDKDITLWAGDRYYQRHDVHIVDNYYWDVSGIGAGIEHINMGPGKLSMALIQDSVDETTNIDKDNGGVSNTGNANDIKDTTGVIADIRYAGIPVWNNAELEVGIDYNYGHKRAEQTIDADDAIMFTASLSQSLDGGFNKTILQLANSGYAEQMTTFGHGNNLKRDSRDNDAKGYRLINWGVLSVSDNLEFGHSIRYAAATDVDGTDTNDSTLSAVIRPVYKWTENMRTVLEIGTFKEEINNVDSAGSKFTVAQAWVPQSGFWSRPEIRVFATYLNDAENSNAFGTGKDTELSVGMQVEAWW